jgi:hypothetical protein
MARPHESNWIKLSKTKGPQALHSRDPFAAGFGLPGDEAIVHDDRNRPAIAPV